MKVQNSKHQQYIKSLLVSSKKLVSKIFSSKKIKFPGISLKSPQKEAFTTSFYIENIVRLRLAVPDTSFGFHPLTHPPENLTHIQLSAMHKGLSAKCACFFDLVWGLFFILDYPQISLPFSWNFVFINSFGVPRWIALDGL